MVRIRRIEGRGRGMPASGCGKTAAPTHTAPADELAVGRGRGARSLLSEPEMKKKRKLSTITEVFKNGKLSFHAMHVSYHNLRGTIAPCNFLFVRLSCGRDCQISFMWLHNEHFITLAV